MNASRYRNSSTLLMRKPPVEQFHLYSEHNTGVSTAEVEKAEAEYEMVAERYRLLLAEFQNEDNVIIRHKPSKVAPIVIPASASRSIEIQAEPEPPIESSAPPEVSVLPEPDTPIPEPNLSSTNERQDRKENGPEFSTVAKKSRRCRNCAFATTIAHHLHLLAVPQVAPEIPENTGLFSSIYRGESARVTGGRWLH